MILELIITFLLVAANGFFVATEFAITRMRPAQVTDLEGRGRAGSGSVRHAVDHIDAYLAACQLGITMASLGLGVVGERVFHELLTPLLGEGARVFSIGLAGLFAFVIITLLHVVLGELAPKSLALSRTEPVSLAVAAPMRIFYMATKPLVDLFNALGNLVLKPFGIPPAREAGHAPASEDELRTLVRQSSEEGLIDPHERRFAENVFAFGDRRTREIMVPRPEVRTVNVGEGAEAAASRARETGHTRFPLCEDDGGLDAAVGVVNVKDLITASTPVAETDLRELARPLPRISDATLVDELLRELRRGRQHMPSSSTSTGPASAWSRSRTCSRRSSERSRTNSTRLEPSSSAARARRCSSAVRRPSALSRTSSAWSSTTRARPRSADTSSRHSDVCHASGRQSTSAGAPSRSRA